MQVYNSHIISNKSCLRQSKALPFLMFYNNVYGILEK